MFSHILGAYLDRLAQKFLILETSVSNSKDMNSLGEVIRLCCLDCWEPCGMLTMANLW